jgi:hypothetical protein
MQRKNVVDAKKVQEEIDKFSKMEVEGRKENIARFIKDFDATLTQNSINAKIPEEMFVKVFLPVFLGEVKVDKQTDYFIQWGAIAGNPLNSVDVVDSEGTILYTVPPLIDTSDISITTDRRETIPLGAMVDNYERNLSMTPAMGHRYWAENASAKLRSLIKPETGKRTEYNKKWEDILARYGKLDKTHNTTDNTSSDSDDDELLFGEE